VPLHFGQMRFALMRPYSTYTRKLRDQSASRSGDRNRVLPQAPPPPSFPRRREPRIPAYRRPTGCPPSGHDVRVADSARLGGRTAACRRLRLG